MRCSLNFRCAELAVSRMETPILVRDGLEFALGDDDVEAYVDNVWQRGKILQIDTEKQRMEIWVSSWYRWFDLNSADIRKCADAITALNETNGVSDCGSVKKFKAAKSPAHSTARSKKVTRARSVCAVSGGLEVVVAEVKPTVLDQNRNDQTLLSSDENNQCGSVAGEPKRKVRRSRAERIVFAQFKQESYYYPGIIRVNREDLAVYKAFRREEYAAWKEQQANTTEAETTATLNGQSGGDAAGSVGKQSENPTANLRGKRRKKTAAETKVEVYYFDNESEFLPLSCMTILEEREPLPVGTQLEVQTNGTFVPDTMRDRNMLRCTTYGTYCAAQIDSVSKEIQREEGAANASATAKSRSHEFLYRLRLGRGLMEEDVPVWKMRLTAEQVTAVNTIKPPNDLADSDFEEVNEQVLKQTGDCVLEQRSVVTVSSGDLSMITRGKEQAARDVVLIDLDSLGSSVELDSTGDVENARCTRRSSRVVTKRNSETALVATSSSGGRQRKKVKLDLDASLESLDGNNTVVMAVKRKTARSSISSADRFTTLTVPDCKPQVKKAAAKKKLAPKSKAACTSTDKKSKASKPQSKQASASLDDSLNGDPLGQGIFDGRSFVLVRATVSVSSQNVPAVDSDRIALLLRRGGGSVRSSFFNSVTGEPDSDVSDSCVPNVPRECYLLAVQHSRIPLYLQAVALGVPCVNYDWVEQCVKSKRLLDYRTFLLPTGSNILTETVILREPRATPVFTNRRFYVVGFTPTFATKWWPVLSAAAGDYLRAPALPPTLTVQQLTAAAEDSSSQLIEEVKASLISSCGTVSSLMQARQLTCDFVLLQTRDECKMENSVVFNLLAEAIRIVNNQLRLSAPDKLVTTDYVSQCILQGRLLDRSSYGRFIPL